MNKKEERKVRKALKDRNDGHLGAFDNGWLDVEELVRTGSKIIRLYSEKRLGREKVLEFHIEEIGDKYG